MMASKVPSSPLVRGFVKRTYALAAVDNQVLAGNLAIASAPSPVKGLCRVAVAVRAGSRYETPDNLGVSHVVRSACGLSTGEATGFSIVRNLDKLGATLSATSDRETLVYTLSADCDNIEKALKVMKQALVRQEFRPWELSEVIPRVRYELATRPGAAIALDLIHKAAFRDGLGNSIYAKDYRLKKIGSETIQHFVNGRFQPSKMAIVGLGVEQPLLSHFAETLKLSGDGGSSSSKSCYKGGEVREEANSPLAYTVIAGEGVSLKDKNAFVYGVLRLAIGGGPSVKRGIGSDPLSKAVSKSAEATAAKAINVSYSDSGLFGILIATTPENSKDAISNAMKALNVTDEDVKRAKTQLKTQALFESESTDGMITDLANQAVLLGGGKAASSLVSEIDSVTTSQVKEALQKFVSGKKSLAAYGNIANVPYLDEL